MIEYQNIVTVAEYGNEVQVDNGASGGVVWIKAKSLADPEGFVGGLSARKARELAAALVAAADYADRMNGVLADA